MKILLQRVSKASVSIDGKMYSSINNGILIFLGIKNTDTQEDAKYLAEKSCSLRIFDDAEGKMNLSVKDIQGSILVVSQFTLYGDGRKGNRPSYTEAAKPEIAEPLYGYFVETLRSIIGKEKIATGVFRAMMDIELVNNGPVTILLESNVK